MTKGETVRKTQGFRPGLFIRLLRLVSGIIIQTLRLHGRTRWSNEFIQALEPELIVDVPFSSTESCTIWFRTGHGRLFWRVCETPYEEPEVNEWIATFGSEDTFLDIGANIGLFSLLAAKLECSQVLSVEADLMNARLLYENVLRNNVGHKVVVLPVGLTSKSHLGRLHLKSLSYGDALHNLDSPSPYVAIAGRHVVSIPAFSFSDLADVLSLPNPTKVKIDVDGHELEILKGLGDRISHVQEIVVEVDPNQPSYRPLQEFMNQAGFQLALEAPPQVAWNSVHNNLYVRRLAV